MIVYSDTINQFHDDVDNGVIADKIQEEFERRGISLNLAEYRAWDSSLLNMKNVLSYHKLDKNIKVAIEYQIPTTSKRVDFLITGKDEYDVSNAVIIELKQWEQAKKTDKEDLVETYVGGGIRVVTHPSYQAYSYAKTIENFNEYIQEKKIKISPCSYLHNYQEQYRSEIDNELYREIINISPLFLKKDMHKLREFIDNYVSKSDNGEILEQIEYGKIRPSKALQDALVSMIRGNREFELLDEQKVAFSTIKKIVEESLKTNEKHTIIVEGGPGTGKSVIAIQLLSHFRKLIVSYVTKNSAPREVYFEKMRKGNHRNHFIKNLFKSSGAFVESNKNDYDCLFVDEAHRLNEKSGFYGHLGESQISEIINAARVSVFFIDEDQVVTTKDYGSIEEIKKQAIKLGSTIHYGEDLKLSSQFRCNGSEGYIAFIDDLLGIRETANYDYFDIDYDIRVYDSPTQMRNELRELNRINNKARMIAGYCYNWVTQNNSNADIFDIELSDGFKAKWNFNSTRTWAIDEDSFEQVGCIHTSQGLEFDYIGIIIGKDLVYKNGKVVTDYTKRARTDKSLSGIKKTQDYDLADRIIRNTYKTLLTRGQKGCYIYCEDKELNDYIKRRLDVVRGNQEK
ncbi:MAG: DNA/RNA helicase domain-containing protein [Acholeplasmatales bacterium]